jgi:hypothetical protein
MLLTQLTSLQPYTYIQSEIMARAGKRMGPEQLIAAALTDNAANVLAAGARIGGGEYYGCAAHTVQLVVQDVIVYN